MPTTTTWSDSERFFTIVGVTSGSSIDIFSDDDEVQEDESFAPARSIVSCETIWAAASEDDMWPRIADDAVADCRLGCLWFGLSCSEEN